MTKLKNGLYIDFEWDEYSGLPILIIADTPHGEDTKMWFNLSMMTMDEAVETAEKAMKEHKENENY